LLACVSPNIALGPQEAQAPSTNSATSVSRPVTSNYKIGPDDEITIYAPYADDISNKRFRIEKSGDVSLPNKYVGRIHAEGLTVEELAVIIKKRLAEIIKSPEVVVRVETPKSQPVVVFGKVNSGGGTVQLEGGMTLLEVLTKVGGLANDAGSQITIQRLIENGPVPLPNAVNDERYSTAQVSVAALTNGIRPEVNIQLMPHDYISVPRADFVYIIGGVMKPGGYALNEKKVVSLIQLLGFAGGQTPTAKLKSAVIYRQLADGSHMSIEVNVADAKKLKSGKPEVMLQADDILEIPDSLVRGTVRRTFDQAVSTLTGVAIYRPFY